MSAMAIADSLPLALAGTGCETLLSVCAIVWPSIVGTRIDRVRFDGFPGGGQSLQSDSLPELLCARRSNMLPRGATGGLFCFLVHLGRFRGVSNPSCGPSTCLIAGR